MQAAVGGALLVALASVSLARAEAVPTSPAPAVGAEGSKPAPRVRLISQEQYFNSLAYVFGPDISVAAHFTPFRRTDGLVATGASVAGVTAGQIDEFQRTAIAMAGADRQPAAQKFSGAVHAEK